MGLADQIDRLVLNYRISSIKRPGRLFRDLFSAWAIIRGGRLKEAGRLIPMTSTLFIYEYTASASNIPFKRL